MKFKLNTLCLVFVLIVVCRCFEDSSDASPETFPFHAVVKGVLTCIGIIISEEYVIAPAVCVSGASTVLVFLGVRGSPYNKSNFNEGNVQKYQCSKAIIHEDYVKVNDYRHLNNIALVKLPYSASLSKNIYPGKLITKEESLVIIGNFVNVTGWFPYRDTKLKVAEAQIRNKDTCRYLFGEHYFRSQELCIRWRVDTQYLNLLGNPVSANGIIIGYQTSVPECVVANELTCTRNIMVLSIVPYLDWIATHTNIKTTQFTEPKKYDTSHIEKIEHLSDIIKAVDKKNGELANSLQLQVNDMKSETRRIETNQNASVLSLQENIGKARTEITNGLSAQKSLSDNFAQRLAALDNKQNTNDERIPAIQKVLEGIKHQTEANTYYIEEVAAKLQPEIDFVKTELNNVGHKAELVQSQVNDYYYEISHSIKNATTSVDHQFHVLNSVIDKVSEKLQYQELEAHKSYESLNVTLNHISTGTEAESIKICKRLDLVEKGVHENKEFIDKQTNKGSIHINDILKELKEQKNVQESLKKCCYSDFDIPPQ